jgi:DNA invertase Pin-like site-specific DNA recombinase
MPAHTLGIKAFGRMAAVKCGENQIVAVRQIDRLSRKADLQQAQRVAKKGNPQYNANR